MICPKCSRVIADNAAFCGYCGATITKTIKVTEEKPVESIAGENIEISEIKTLNEIAQVDVIKHDIIDNSHDDKDADNENVVQTQQSSVIGTISVTQGLDNVREPINKTVPMQKENIKNKHNKEKNTATQTDNKTSTKSRQNKAKNNTKTNDKVNNYSPVNDNKTPQSKATKNTTERKENTDSDIPSSTNNQPIKTTQAVKPAVQQPPEKKKKMGRGGIIAVSLSVSIVLIASVVFGVLYSKGAFNKEKPEPENPNKIISNNIGNNPTTEISLDVSTEYNTNNSEATTQLNTDSQTEESTTGIDESLTTANEDSTTSNAQVTAAVVTTKIADSTKAPGSQAPTTRAPVTQAPVTQAPATRAPVTQAPTTRPPATQAPTTVAAPRQTSVHSYTGKVDNSKLVVIDDSSAVLTDSEYTQLRNQMQQIARSKNWNLMVVFSNSGVNYDTNPNKDELARQYYNNMIGSNGGSDLVGDGFILIIDTVSNTYTFNIYGYAAYSFADVDPADLGGGINSYVSYDDFYGAVVYLLNY